MKSVGVNTPSVQEQELSPTSVMDQPSQTTGGYSFMLGDEEEALQAMLRELLAAFPTQTTKSM